MSAPNDGGPAFPVPRMVYERGPFQEGGPSDTVIPESCGMSLRDWFAGMALQGLMVNYDKHPNSVSACADIAVEAANTLIAKLKRKEDA